ncbi:hypothetical protein [Tardiphaga sp. 367_B4_N1_1]|uniref:hypothetical protein n=1 Tax=Tardiphaga sp. 367_B4_N1_1 TaxID=3240777 RepID=UPI003F298FB1
MTREDIRNAASTLAHHWASRDPQDREGVRRLIAAYPLAIRVPLCALILERVHATYPPEALQAFDNLLFDMADIEEAL